jgi:hypothetical protein
MILFLKALFVTALAASFVQAVVYVVTWGGEDTR